MSVPQMPEAEIGDAEHGYSAIFGTCSQYVPADSSRWEGLRDQ